MSLFIKVNDGVSPTRLYRSNQLITDIGVGALGEISLDKPTLLLCRVYSCADRYLFTPVATLPHSLDKETSQSTTNVTRPLAAPERIVYQQYTIELFATSPSAEVLAAIPMEDISTTLNRLAQRPRIYLKVSLAGANRSYPLYEGLRIQAGSHEQCAIQLAVSGVAAFHCAFTARDQSVEIEPVEGGVMSIHGTDRAFISRTSLIATPTKVVLAPCGLVLELL